MKKITISPEILTKEGYLFYKKDLNESGHIVGLWQKKIYDDSKRIVGGYAVKYFINITQTLGFNDPRLPVDRDSCNWWPTVQFKIPHNGSYMSIEISLVQWLNNSGSYTGITVESIEKKIDEIWTKLEGCHYDN